MNTITHFDQFAATYDEQAAVHNWIVPDVIFGLQYEYLPPRAHILDIGCGTGLSSRLYKKAGYHVSGVDGSIEMLKKAQEKNIISEFHLLDLASISQRKKFPLRDAQFDGAHSCGCFYFLKDLKSIHHEIYRILKTGGTFAYDVEHRETVGKKITAYTNIDNDSLIEERKVGDLGVSVYCHSKEHIVRSAKQAGFTLKKWTKHLSYHSPSENRDVYFATYLFQK